MNLSIVGKQLELTDAIKAHVASGKSSLEKYNLDIISMRAVLSADERNGKKGFSAEFAINLAHQNTIVIKQKDKDLYAAVDLAIDRARKVLRRHHDKLTTHKGKTKESLEVKEESFENVDEIIPKRLRIYKPMQIEEALEELKESRRQFLVFIDKADAMRILYKKKNENQYGLY